MKDPPARPDWRSGVEQAWRAPCAVASALSTRARPLLQPWPKATTQNANLASRRSAGGGRRRRAARQSTEHRAGHQSRPARVVVIEEAAHQLAGRVEAGDGALLAV